MSTTSTAGTAIANSSDDVVRRIVVGVDIGAESTKVVLGPNQGCEIVRNDVGGHTTPTIVALSEQPQQPRQLGIKTSGGAKQAVYHLNRLLPDELPTNDLLQPYYPFSMSSSSPDCNSINLQYNGTSENFSIAALLGMFLGKLQQNAKSTVERQQQQPGNNSNNDNNDGDDDKINAPASNNNNSNNNTTLLLSVACPRDWSLAAQQELINAAYAAGTENVQLIDRSVAYQATYARKFPEHLDKYVLIVDMGHADTTVSLLGPPPPLPLPSPASLNKEATTTDAAAAAAASSSVDDQEEGKEVVKQETKEETKDDAVSVSNMTVLATQRHKGLGAGVVDVRLWHHFQSTHSKLGVDSLTPTSRGGQRLLAGMSKLKHLLSQLPEGNVTVENVGANDTDVTLEATRKLLVELCSEEVQALTNLVQQVLSTAGVEASQLYSVEVLGGGCRMPWVKEVLEKATQRTLSHTLDDTSAALGAALVVSSERLQPDAGGEGASGADAAAAAVAVGILASRTSTEEPTERQMALRAAEETMAQQDEQLQLRSSILNQMESHILALRSAKHETHGDLLPEELFSYLDAMEDWLFSPEADEADYEKLQSKWQEVKEKSGELSKSYNEAIETDRKAKEAEMEAEAAKAQKEREGEDNAGDDDDHDNRRLPKKRRMEIVMKNKKEGGELFSDGNFKFAAARYAKALSHCAKFVDLGPDDLKEVNDMKLTLNLNLALAYLKLENPDQALRYCNDALALDENHTKALFRRASVLYEKKNWEGASKDLTKALKAAPGDKALQKLQDKVDAQIKRLKAKEKKMAQKMFG